MDTAQVVSRLDRGAIRENCPKYRAERGTVNSIVPRLTATVPTRGPTQRRQGLGNFCSQALLHGCPKTKIPTVDRKENCKPGLAMA